MTLCQPEYCVSTRRWCKISSLGSNAILKLMSDAF